MASFLPSSTMNNSTTKERLLTVIDLLAHQSNQFNQQINAAAKKPNKLKSTVLGKTKKENVVFQEHSVFLVDVISQLRNICDDLPSAMSEILPHASTPYRLNQHRMSIGSPLARSSKYIHSSLLNFLFLYFCSIFFILSKCIGIS